jgi:hypothetical protein
MLDKIFIDESNQKLRYNENIDLRSRKGEFLDEIEDLFFYLNYDRVLRFDSSIKVKNGEKSRNGWYNDPLKWENQISIILKGDLIILEIEWNIKNQSIDKNTHNFFENFIGLLTSSLSANSIDKTRFKSLRTKVSKQGRFATLKIIFGIITSMVVAFFITIKFDNMIYYFPILFFGIWLSIKLLNK